MQLSHLDRCPLLSIAAPIGEERGERREERGERREERGERREERGERRGWQRLVRVRERCNAKVHTQGMEIVKRTNEHLHAPDEQVVSTYETKVGIKRKAREM